MKSVEGIKEGEWGEVAKEGRHGGGRELDREGGIEWR